MRRDQHIEAEIAVAPGLAGRLQPALDDEHVAPRIGGDAQPQRIARVLVHDLDRRHARAPQPQRIVLVALDLGPETVGAGDDKPEIADLRNVDARVIDLVDDAEAEREPQPRRAEAQPTMSLALLVQVGGVPGCPGAIAAFAGCDSVVSPPRRTRSRSSVIGRSLCPGNNRASRDMSGA